MKLCPKCNKVFDLSFFGSNKSTKDGKNCYCRECVRKISFDRKEYHLTWRTKNRDYVNTYSKKWVAENKPKRKETLKKYLNKQDKGFRNEYHCLRYRKDIESSRLKVREWRTNNPDAVRAIKNRRRARLLSAIHEPYRASDIYKRDENKCAYCNDIATCLDHVVPLSRGGADADYNLVAACRPCNTSKFNRLLSEWKRPTYIGTQNVN